MPEDEDINYQYKQPTSKHQTDTGLPIIAESEEEDKKEINVAGDAKMDVSSTKKDQEVKDLIGEGDISEKGQFYKRLRKAINLADTPARKQKLQNRLDLKLAESKKTAEKRKEKGEKKLERKGLNITPTTPLSQAERDKKFQNIAGHFPDPDASGQTYIFGRKKYAYDQFGNKIN